MAPNKSKRFVQTLKIPDDKILEFIPKNDIFTLSVKLTYLDVFDVECVTFINVSFGYDTEQRKFYAFPFASGKEEDSGYYIEMH